MASWIKVLATLGPTWYKERANSHGCPLTHSVTHATPYKQTYNIIDKTNELVN